MADDTKMKVGDYVIIRRLNSMKAIQIRRDRQVYMEKFKFNLAGAIGFPYGTTFEVKQGQLLPSYHEDSRDASGDIEQIRDNRNLEDKRSNQALSREDINLLQRGGASGQEIVNQLVENSATFKEKTEFAQQKYIKKKKKKHLAKFTFLRPTARLLVEMYYNKGPAKICNLRADSFAQMLTQGNVRAHSRLLVVETCNGLLLGGIMERLGGFGSVVHLYSGCMAVRGALDFLNLPQDFWKILHSFPLNLVNTLKRQAQEHDVPILATTGVTQSSENVENDRKDHGVGQQNASPASKDSKGTSESEEDMDLSNVNSQVDTAETQDQDYGDCGRGSQWKTKNQAGKKRKALTEDERKRRKLLKQREVEDARKIIQEGNMDGLLVASKFHPTPIVLSLLEFVAPSRPIVIFSQYREPLLDCYKQLRDHSGVVYLKLTETWLRHHQVLPNRTHPNIMMSGNSGYLLTCTTVQRR